MRKVTAQTVDALVNGYKKTSGNTAVMRDDKFGYERWSMLLHGNKIAEKDVRTNILTIYDGGWESVTTKERLNGILSRLAPDFHIIQKSHVWYLVDGNGALSQWMGAATFRAGKLNNQFGHK